MFFLKEFVLCLNVNPFEFHIQGIIVLMILVFNMGVILRNVFKVTQLECGTLLADSDTKYCIAVELPVLNSRNHNIQILWAWIIQKIIPI